MPKLNNKTHDAVLGPIPGRSTSAARASATESDLSRVKSPFGKAFSAALTAAWMRGALVFARPPLLIVSATAADGAAMTSCQVGKRSFNAQKARDELMSEVFCDRIVATSSSSGGP
jgi:hypothetical protein